MVMRALLAVFPDKDGAASQHGVLELADSAGRLLGALVANDTTPLGTSVFSLEDVRLINISSLAHVILQILPTRLVCEVPNINRCAPSTTASLEPSEDSTSTTTTTSSTSSLPVLTDKYHSSLQLSVCKCADGLLSLRGRGKLDDTTSLGAPVMLLHHFGEDHLASITHVILEILPSHVPRQVSYVNATCLGVSAGCVPATPATSASRSRASAAGMRLLGVVSST
mmetsp:Transcript_30732/g.92048  ORF Transcript_30732/g.92048 Transcript_30732/m.92048 type:complete len:225 (-) Transcript_30732:682-1356(-)